VGIWGLAFKPETDDIRYAPALDVIYKLLGKGAKITAYDPIATNNVRAIIGDNITYATTAEQVLNSCDFLIILTEWKAFFTLPANRFSCATRQNRF